jgi:hypothetical protein
MSEDKYPDLLHNYRNNPLVIKWMPILAYNDRNITSIDIEKALICAKELESYEKSISSKKRDSEVVKTHVERIRKKYSIKTA